MTPELRNAIYDVLVEEAGAPDDRDARKAFSDTIDRDGDWYFMGRRKAGAMYEYDPLFIRYSGLRGQEFHLQLQVGSELTEVQANMIQRTNKRLAELMERVK